MAKTFKQVALNNESLMIVDALNMAFSFRGQSDYLDSYMKMVNGIRGSYKCGKVIIACDWGSSAYRKNLLPTYKGNREELRANQSEEDKQQFEAFFKEFNRIIAHIETETDFPLLRFNKVEADDVSAYIVKNRKKYKIKQIWLISSDRDYDLLLSEDVNRFSYVTRKEYTIDNWLDHYNYLPEHHISIKVLNGDSGDNILGVPGIGPVKAAGLIEKYGSVYDLIEHMPIQSKYKYIQNLNAFGEDNLLLNYKLMDLLEFCHEAIGPENCNTIDKVLEEYLNGN